MRVFLGSTPARRRLSRSVRSSRPVFIVRFGIRDLEKQYAKSENDIKALQSVGQIIAEVLKQLDKERCTFIRLTRLSHCQVLKWASLYCRMPQPA